MYLNAAIIGLGIGEAHLKSLKKNRFIKKIKIFDKKISKAQFFSKKYAVEKCENINEIFNDKNIGLICIASNDKDHFKHIHKSLISGKHVFVEKPALLSKIQAEKTLKILKKNKNLFFYTNHILRKSERFIKIKTIINQKKLGKIYYFEGDYNYGRIKKITNGWRGKIKNYSITLGGGIHVIDLMNFFLNKKVYEIKSYANNLVTKNSKFKNYDFIVSILKLKDNTIAKITSNFGCVYPHFHKLNIYGTKGTFENEYEFGKIFKRRDNQNFTKILNKYKPLNKGLLLDDFVYSIIKNKNRNKYIKEVFDCLSICFAINKSVSTNKTIKVKYIK